MAGKPWIVRLIERLQSAASVGQIVVTCREREREIEGLVQSARVSIVADGDPMVVGRSLEGNHDGVAFCPVSQLFADPGRLNVLAGLDVQPDTAKVFAVLACDPTIPLTGGAFLEVVTRVGLHSSAPDAAEEPKAAAWQTWPAPPKCASTRGPTSTGRFRSRKRCLRAIPPEPSIDSKRYWSATGCAASRSGTRWDRLHGLSSRYVPSAPVVRAAPSTSESAARHDDRCGVPGGAG